MFDLLLKLIHTSREKSSVEIPICQKALREAQGSSIMSLEVAKSKGENIKEYSWNSRRKMLPFKARMVSTDNTEKLLQIWP